MYLLSITAGDKFRGPSPHGLILADCFQCSPSDENNNTEAILFERVGGGNSFVMMDMLSVQMPAQNLFKCLSVEARLETRRPAVPHAQTIWAGLMSDMTLQSPRLGPVTLGALHRML